MTGKLLTIAVCTYNRRAFTVNVINDLLKQNPDFKKIELMVVDNNSSDDTASWIRQNYSSQQVQYVFEKCQGLSHARNRGHREAKGGFVAFLDDDARIPDDWIKNALEIIQALNPDLFGGPYFAFYLENKPVWFKDAYGSREISQEARFLTRSEFLSGGNMVLRKDILDQLGGFLIHFGMSGNRISYGEETALFAKLWAQNPVVKIYYSPSLHILHYVRPEKYDLLRCLRMQFKVGYDNCLALKNISAPLPLPIEWYFKYVSLIGGIFFSFLGCLFRDRIQFPYYQNYLYEKTFKIFKQLGHWWAVWEIMKSKNIYY